MVSKEKQKPRATYADLAALPKHLVGEILHGELIVSPRPGPNHTHASSDLGMLIGSPFRFGRGGPGGWRILDEPELHLGEDVLVPDLAGWRLERMPERPKTAFFELVPDWVCEVLSPSTEVVDRGTKLGIYQREGVAHLWLLSPRSDSLTLEVLRLEAGGYLLLGVHLAPALVRAEPFDAVELDLGLLLDEPEPDRNEGEDKE